MINRRSISLNMAVSAIDLCIGLWPLLESIEREKLIYFLIQNFISTLFELLLIFVFSRQQIDLLLKFRIKMLFKISGILLSFLILPYKQIYFLLQLCVKCFMHLNLMLQLRILLFLKIQLSVALLNFLVLSFKTRIYFTVQHIECSLKSLVVFFVKGITCFLKSVFNHTYVSPSFSCENI